MRVSLVVRSLSTRTVAWADTVGVSAERPSKVDRSAATSRVTSRRILSPPSSLRAARSRWRTPSAWQSLWCVCHYLGTGVVDDAKISRAVSKIFDFRPAALIAELDLPDRSIDPPLRTATSGAPRRASPGSGRTDDELAAALHRQSIRQLREQAGASKRKG